VGLSGHVTLVTTYKVSVGKSENDNSEDLDREGDIKMVDKKSRM
jgi:hypothetical protein